MYPYFKKTFVTFFLESKGPQEQYSRGLELSPCCKPAELQKIAKDRKLSWRLCTNCKADCTVTQLMVHYHYQNQILNWHLKKLEPPYAVSKLIWVSYKNSNYR